MIVLQTNQLHKNYKNICAVNRLDLKIEKGNLYGILGPNGSGKTTTLGMLLDIIRPSSGSFSWFGQPPSALQRRRIGSILETPNFYPYMDAVQNLELVAHIKKVSSDEIPELLEVVGLSDRATTPFKSYSLGMKQRLAIAGALLGDPEVLIFDEPTNGLDPQGIVEVRNLLIEIGARGKTILLASHIIDEVEKICSHVAIIKYGNLLASGAVTEILSQEPVIEVAAEDMSILEKTLSESQLIQSCQLMGTYLELKLQEGIAAKEVNKFAFDKGLVLTHLKTRKKSLETEFLERTS